MTFQERVHETILKMPLAMRQLIALELEAENEVAELSAGELPGSVVVRLFYAFRRLPEQLPSGVVYSERTETDPMNFDCSTDDGLWLIRFAKFKPFPLLSPIIGPDPRVEHVAAMETVQVRETEAEKNSAARKARELPVRIDTSPLEGLQAANVTHPFPDQFEIETDFRGETLRYIEAGRRTQMMWTWMNGYAVYADTIGPWQYADGTQTPVSEGERETVLHRVVQYGSEKQGVKIKVQ